MTLQLPDRPREDDDARTLIEKLERLWEFLEEKEREIEPDDNQAEQVAAVREQLDIITNTIENIRGDGRIQVHASRYGVSLTLAPEQTEPMLLPKDAGFWAWASANASDGDNKWSYTFAEIEKTSAGYGGWAALTGGRTGTMRNTIEDINAAAGVQGNGVTAANLDTADYTFTIQPLPNSVPVWVRGVVVTDNTVEYWFSYANGVDGSCD